MDFNLEQRDDLQWYAVFTDGTVLGGYDKATIARVCANAYVQAQLITAERDAYAALLNDFTKAGK